MIPLAIELEGFLSFRDKHRLEFPSNQITLLCGENGSGKSSVFDGILLSLFGGCRLGGEPSVHLINKASDLAKVALEFQNGDERYRVERTLARQVGTYEQTAQLKSWNEKAGDWKPVKQAAKITDCNKRLKELLGISYEGFTTSVLLLQGRAETLLNQDSKTAEVRFKALAAIVGLDFYAELHKRADKRRLEQDKAAAGLRKQLELFPEVSAEQIEKASQEIQKAEVAGHNAARKATELEEIKKQADEWQRLNGELARAQKKREEQDRLFADEKAIQDNAKRLAEAYKRKQDLALVQSPLKGVAKHRENWLKATAALQSWTNQLIKHEGEESAKAQAIPLLQRAFTEVELKLSEAEKKATQAETKRDETRARQKRFDTVAGGAVCSWCGQQLSAEHAEKERKHIANELEDRQRLFEQADQDRARWKTEKQKAKMALEHAQTAHEGAKVATRTAREKRDRFQENSNTENTALLAAYEDLPPFWRQRIATTDPVDWAQTKYPSADDLSQITQELQGLESQLLNLPEAEKRDQALQQARGERAALENNIADLEKQLAAIPEHCRKDPNAVGKELDKAREEVQQFGISLARSTDKRDDLLKQQGERVKLGEQSLQADHKHAIAEKLADLLDDKHLQRHLIHQAEVSIITHANRVLDRLSAGMLRLRLLEAEENTKGKALSFVVEKPDGHEYAIISGSERFRVAISLALGIGQFASRLHCPIETVIIDEGFGCLDAKNRVTMMEEIDLLRGELKCILLVSHLDDFAERFPYGYRFTLEDGTTRVAAKSA
jgi:DNA repair protein SbcC/Rad50